MSELEILENKLRLLLKQYTTLQGEYSRLQRKTQQQEERSKEQLARIADLEGLLQAKALTEAGDNATNNGREELKKYLDLVIEEINKNIISLK